MTRIGLLAVAFVMAASIGCVPGYNSMIFATKTNMGLVVDTKPPEVNLDIGRYEGLLAPSYEAGKTPPVMSSFRFSSQGWFRNYLGSVFTTGDAAVAVSRLYSAPDWPAASRNDGEGVWEITPDQWQRQEKLFDSGVPLRLPPKQPFFVPKEEPGAVRPVLFGTDTSLGFKVSWSGANSVMPDYMRLAYQRRELAFAGVTVGNDIEEVKNENGEVTNRIDNGLKARVPSLLATLDADLETNKFVDSKVGYIQYFSSGSAATALAMRLAVRNAMLKRFDPEQEPEIPTKTGTIGTEPDRVRRQDRVQNWFNESTATTRNALETARTTAESAASAQPADEKLKATAARAKRFADAAILLEKRNPSIALTIGKVRREAVQQWLRKDKQVMDSVTFWLYEAGTPLADIDAAIALFDIPQ